MYKTIYVLEILLEHKKTTSTTELVANAMAEQWG